MCRLLLSLSLLLLALSTQAQYPPQAGIAGSTAIPGSSPQFVGWATGCTVQRGLRNIAWPDSGYVSAGTPALATGAADNSLVSLGDSGVAVLTFLHPITDGAGPDFAVFENGFANPQNAEEAFLELAFVEVSSDGINYTRFPATSLTRDTFQMSSVAGSTYCNARLLNNLAGKYTAGKGTPFDLAELQGTPGLDLQHITHVRIVDVIGDVGGHASYDAGGRKINDPYPTPFPTGGFDLDAVGVLHQSNTGIGNTASGGFDLYPNPARDDLHVALPCDAAAFRILDGSGRMLMQGGLTQKDAVISLKILPAGFYIIRITDTKSASSWTGKLYRQ